MPNFVIAPWAAAIAVGTANDSAQGQLATNTATKTDHDLLGSNMNQRPEAIRAVTSKKRMKWLAQRSAKLTK